MQLTLDTKGLLLKRRNNSFQIISKTESPTFSPDRITSIAINTFCGLSSSAIRLAIQHKIPIYFIDQFGNVDGRVWSASFGHLSTLRRQQVYYAISLAATDWVVELLSHKFKNQCQHLRNFARLHPSKKEKIDLFIGKADLTVLDFAKGKLLRDCAGQIRGNEGIFSKNYWQIINEIIPAEWAFANRNRQPATDAFNAATNYCYGMLYTYVETALFSVGLDPYLGIFHADQYDKPTLSYDLIEPFRPWADNLLTELIGSKKLDIKQFELIDSKMVINKAGKAVLIPAFHIYFNEKVDFLEGRTSRKNHIYRYAGRLVEILKKFKN